MPSRCSDTRARLSCSPQQRRHRIARRKQPWLLRALLWLSWDQVRVVLKTIPLRVCERTLLLSVGCCTPRAHVPQRAQRAVARREQRPERGGQHDAHHHEGSRQHCAALSRQRDLSAASRTRPPLAGVRAADAHLPHCCGAGPLCTAPSPVLLHAQGPDSHDFAPRLTRAVWAKRSVYNGLTHS